VQYYHDLFAEFLPEKPYREHPIGCWFAATCTTSKIATEKLGNQLANLYDVDILCGYSVGNHGGMDTHLFQQICAQHSAVHSR